MEVQAELEQRQQERDEETEQAGTARSREIVRKTKQEIARKTKQTIEIPPEPAYFIGPALLRFGVGVFFTLSISVLLALFEMDKIDELSVVYYIGFMGLFSMMIMLSIAGHDDDEMTSLFTLGQFLSFFFIQVSETAAMLVLSCCALVATVIMGSFWKTQRYNAVLAKAKKQVNDY